MKNKILTLLVAVMILVLAIPAQAATVSTPFLSTMDGEKYYNADIPTSGSYGRIARTSATDLKVIKEADGNYAFKLADGFSAKQSMIVYTYTNEAGTGYQGGDAFVSSPYVSMKAKIKFTNTSGRTQLFALSKSFSKTLPSNVTDTAGVYLENGGASYYDFENSTLVNFIEEGTLETGKWYTVEAVFEMVEDGNTKMAAIVYDEDGYVIGKSPLKKVTSLTWYSTSKAGTRYTRTYIMNTGYPAGDYTLIDDVSLYTLEISPVICNSQEIAEDCSYAEFEFSDELDVDTVNKGNVILEAVGSELDTSEMYEVSYDNGVLRVDFENLPFTQAFKLTITTNVGIAGDVFGISEPVEVEFVSPEDPLNLALDTVKFNNGDDIKAGDDVVVSMTIDNTTKVKREYMLLVTSWNSKNECIAIRNCHGFLEPGQDTTLSAPAVKFADEESIIRVSLVDNWFNLVPVGDAVTFELGGN